MNRPVQTSVSAYTHCTPYRETTTQAEQSQQVPLKVLAFLTNTVEQQYRKPECMGYALDASTKLPRNRLTTCTKYALARYSSALVHILTLSFAKISRCYLAVQPVIIKLEKHYEL